ncbi:hypothetical protein TNCV_411381 [Trichonephila clavipes]|nr:hypothetical protein TNCV_411381 [Trichonephila clavipes]
MFLQDRQKYNVSPESLEKRSANAYKKYDSRDGFSPERVNITLLCRNPTRVRIDYDILPELVHSYNHSIHHALGFEPAKVTTDDEPKLYKRLYHSNIDPQFSFAA